MFTGLIADMGTIKAVNRRGADACLEIGTAFDLGDVNIGDSLSVDGVCLTVTTKGNRSFTADVSAETMSRTTLKWAQPGERVNLEKSVRLGGLLGGHLVLGHVDGLGQLRERMSKGGSIVLGCDVPPDLARYMASKGSIAVDGVSLTINDCRGTRFYVNIVPHTAGKTTLGNKRIGSPLNLEMDIIAKYVERLLDKGTAGRSPLERFLSGKRGSEE